MNLDASPVIDARGVTKQYGAGDLSVAALRGVDLQARRGEFLAIMGRSGSGKSTLLHLCAGLDLPTAGAIYIDGRDVTQMSDDDLTLLRRRRIGLIFQAFNLVDVLTAEENVALPLVVDGVSEREASQRALRALSLVGLEKRGHHLPKELSGGEQQRVAIARALVIEPVVLLADEPTGNLDTANSEQVIHLLRDLVSDQERTIVMVTHDPRQADVADRVVEIQDGRIVRD